MSGTDRHNESMLFNYETTMKDDYRDGEIKDIKRTFYKEKPKNLKVRPPLLLHAQTLTEWKNPYIPIEFLVKPKEVVRTNPSERQKPYVPEKDLDKERVRSTRPRLVMTPAVSMDDIVDEHKRQILVKEMYTSSAKSAMELGIMSVHNQHGTVKAPLPDTLAPTNPITIKKLQFLCISPEWRMETVSWDARQVRAHSDPSKEFYLARTPKCKFCDETAAREMERRMLRKMKRKNT